MSGAPRCHNRPERPATVAVNAGYVNGVLTTVMIPSAFVDRCAAHDGTGIGPNGEGYPEAHGWLPYCASCKWNPKGITG